LKDGHATAHAAAPLIDRNIRQSENNPTAARRGLYAGGGQAAMGSQRKALAKSPSVLDQLAKNLAWTSALGDAAYNQQKDVLASVQRLRQQAKAAGNLKSSKEIQIVQQDPRTIVASKALYDSAKAGDKATLEAILGDSLEPILSSCDPHGCSATRELRLHNTVSNGIAD
jgi:hypothetical protein